MPHGMLIAQRGAKKSGFIFKRFFNLDSRIHLELSE